MVIQRKAQTPRKVRETVGDVVFSAINYIFVTVIALAMLYPILNVIAVSMAENRDYLTRPWMILPKVWNFDGYRYIFRNSMFWRSYLNSILVTGVGTVLGLTLTVLTAYPLSRRELKCKPLFMAVIVFTMVFNAGTIPGYLNMQELKLLNTYWSQIFPYAFTAFNCILMINSFRELPYEMIEAAQIDGASEPYILARVVLPLSKPVLATIALFLAVGYWNNYFAAQLYCALDRNLWPIAMTLKQIMAEASTAILEAAQDPSAATLASKLGGKTIQYAAVVVSTLPIMCVYPFLQKYFAKGVMVGGVKG